MQVMKASEMRPLAEEKNMGWRKKTRKPPEDAGKIETTACEDTQNEADYGVIDEKDRELYNDLRRFRIEKAREKRPFPTGYSTTAPSVP